MKFACTCLLHHSPTILLRNTVTNSAAVLKLDCGLLEIVMVFFFLCWFEEKWDQALIVLVSSSENLHKPNYFISFLHSGWQLFRLGTRLVFLNFFSSFNRVIPKGLFRSGVTSSCFPPRGCFCSPLYIRELRPTGLYSCGTAINLTTPASTTLGLHACPMAHVHLCSLLPTAWHYQEPSKIALGVRSPSCLRLIFQTSFQAWLNLILPTSKTTQKSKSAVTQLTHSPAVLYWAWHATWLSTTHSPSSPSACGFQQKAVFQPCAPVYQLFEILYR